MPDMEHAHAQFEFDIAAGCSQALGPSHHIIAKCLIAGDKDESRRQAGPPDRHKVEKRQRLASESRRASCFRTLDVGVAVSRQFAIAVYPTSGTRQPHATRCRPPSGVRSASCRREPCRHRRHPPGIEQISMTGSSGNILADDDSMTCRNVRATTQASPPPLLRSLWQERYRMVLGWLTGISAGALWVYSGMPMICH